MKNAENKLRDLYLKLKHKNYTDVQLRDNTDYITKIFRAGLVHKHSNKNKAKAIKQDNNDSNGSNQSSDNAIIQVYFKLIMIKLFKFEYILFI